MMKKRILMLLMVLCLATACGKVPKLSNGKEAIVSFKDTKLSISAEDLYAELKDKYALSIIVDLIDKKMLLAEYPDDAKAAKKSADEELKKIKEYYVDDNGKYDENSLLAALQQYYGITTIAEFEAMLELNYYRGKAIEDYAKKQITDKQIDNYYKDEIVGDIECSHILIGVNTKADATADEKKTAEEAALKKAKEVIKELDAGGDFKALAKKYSTDTSNSEKGGELGYFNKGEMVAAFEKAAYALKLNTYSKEPVKTEFGYHIILKTGEKEKETLANTKTKIINTLASALQNSDATLSINALVDLRKAYGVEIEDSSINSKYSTFISNQLINAQSKS